MSAAVRRSELLQIPSATRRQSGFKRPAALITLILLLAPACDLPEREPPKVVTISNVPTFRPSSPEQVQTVEQAMVAARVVDALGWRSYDLTLRRIRLELARHHESIPALSNLSD